MSAQIKHANNPQLGTSSSTDPDQLRAGFAVEITSGSEPLAEWVYYDAATGHRTALARCHADGRVDFPTIGPGWPFNLGDVSRIGTQVW